MTVILELRAIGWLIRYALHSNYLRAMPETL
jgi:hypothetical protein